LAVRIVNLRLQKFKNYREADLTFSKNVIGLFGKNGSGKTNILDAIHYLSFTKSVLNNQDQQNVMNGENFFTLEGAFEHEKKSHVIRCTYDGKKKRFSEDGSEYSRFSEHIGKFPVVIITPQDINLIWEGGEGRRRFFDQWLSQSDRNYLEHLVLYSQLLKQRNSLLKQAQQRGMLDDVLMDSYHQQMIPAAKYIYGARKKFVDEINPALADEYAALVKAKEQVHVVHTSDLDSASAEAVLNQSISQEIAAGRTLGGIHLDEYQFLLHDFEVRKFGSQGQQKSFLIGLKWVEIKHSALKRGFSPIVLLDDIFDKMDDERIARLLIMIGSVSDAQFFITDANPGRSREIFKKAKLDYQEFIIESGIVNGNL
jgi:DNA replication and repair protein RecF